MAIPLNDDIRFEITTKCNYNCLICPRDKLTRKIETMSFELFKELLDKILKETIKKYKNKIKLLPQTSLTENLSEIAVNILELYISNDTTELWL